MNQRIRWRDKRLPERFWNKVARNEKSGCWEWTGAIRSSGYATYHQDSRMVSAHRVIKQFEGLGDLHVDHLCKNRICVNPSHLDMVTQRENNRRLFGYVNTGDNCLDCKSMPISSLGRCRECYRAFCRQLQNNRYAADPEKARAINRERYWRRKKKQQKESQL